MGLTDSDFLTDDDFMAPPEVDEDLPGWGVTVNNTGQIRICVPDYEQEDESRSWNYYISYEEAVTLHALLGAVIA